MKPEDIDRILVEAARTPLPPDAGRTAMDRVKSALLTDLHPVRPVASPWLFTLTFVVLFAAAATAAAILLGPHGIRVLSPEQRLLIFPALLASAWLAAIACVREMRPAAGPPLGAPALVVVLLGFPALFALLLRTYSLLGFVAEGVPCLVAGMTVSIPTGIVMAFILRRGFVLRWSAASIAAGTLSGLSGLGMLELHCPNLKAIHVMVWHVAVVLTSALLGFAVGWIADRMRSRRTR